MSSILEGPVPTKFMGARAHSIILQDYMLSKINDDERMGRQRCRQIYASISSVRIRYTGGRDLAPPKVKVNRNDSVGIVCNHDSGILLALGRRHIKVLVS